jgi:hypothetical protein
MAGLLTYSVCFQRLPIRLGMNSGFWLKPLLELTAAGTVAEFHGIPFYPFPDHCAAKVGRIPCDVQVFKRI